MIELEKDLESRNKQLTSLLTSNKLEITFTKVNGEARVMPCTLDPMVVPPKVLAEGEVAKVRKPNLETISVWCTDKNEWRAFKTMNVTEVKILD